MQPVGGLMLIVHLAIIAIVKIKRALFSFFRNAKTLTVRHAIPTAITLSILAIVALTSINFLSASAYTDSSFQYISGYLFGGSNTCLPIEVITGDREVVLRVDDIQQYAWRDIAMRMVNDSVSRNATLVLGTIPYGIENDAVLVDFLKKNGCNIEIAQHGWSTDIAAHNISEIEKRGESIIYKNLIDARSELEKVTGQKVVTFIPPNNLYSNKTASALKKANFSVISSDNKGIYDSTTLTYDYQKNVPIPTEKIISDCESNFQQGLPCIIMIHPQDFATNGKLDESKYSSFINLLDELNDRNVNFVRFKDIANQTYGAAPLKSSLI